jgi:sulfate adenylyltransferase subunit 1
MTALTLEPPPPLAAKPLPTPADAARPALRFLTAGSVDDGKSTLIGRLLLDSQALLADQIETLTRRAGGLPPDLSLVTDGLEAEREQGITIDVAYRYFATPSRKFIIADAPGHEQYTRNMVTAAAGSDAAVVLVDITKLDWRRPPVKLLPQTRRHALLARQLRVPSVVFAVNKLDAVDDPAAAFAAVREALETFAAEAGIVTAGCVPVSALRGDHVAVPGWTDWHQGPTLLELLESLPSGSATSGAPNAESSTAADGALRLPVQYVARDPAHEGQGDLSRVIWGRIAAGRVRRGDTVTVFPAGTTARVVEVRRAGERVEGARAGQSAGLVLDRQIDVSRGDWLGQAEALQASEQCWATLAWLDVEPAVVGRKYWLRHSHRWVQARLSHIAERLDIHTLRPEPASSLGVNELGTVCFELHQPLPLQPFEADRVGGALIVVDPATHRTSGAALVAAGAPTGDRAE